MSEYTEETTTEIPTDSPRKGLRQIQLAVETDNEFFQLFGDAAATSAYLVENYGSNPEITKLVDGNAFYLLPTQNPDGRAHWFEEANTAHSSRSGVQPHDDDGDGLVDEDCAIVADREFTFEMRDDTEQSLYASPAERHVRCSKLNKDVLT